MEKRRYIVYLFLYFIIRYILVRVEWSIYYEPKTQKKFYRQSSRLIVTLTIASGAALLVKMAFSAWFQTFSTRTYTKNFLSFDYLFSILFVTVTILGAFSIGRYLFFELKTFIYYENSNEQQLAYEASDNAYKNIFKTIKKCFNVVFSIMVIITLIEVFKNKDSWKYILIGASIGGICILSLSLLIGKN